MPQRECAALALVHFFYTAARHELVSDGAERDAEYVNALLIGTTWDAMASDGSTTCGS